MRAGSLKSDVTRSLNHSFKCHQFHSEHLDSKIERDFGVQQLGKLRVPKPQRFSDLFKAKELNQDLNLSHPDSRVGALSTEPSSCPPKTLNGWTMDMVNFPIGFLGCHQKCPSNVSTKVAWNWVSTPEAQRCHHMLSIICCPVSTTANLCSLEERQKRSLPHLEQP